MTTPDYVRYRFATKVRVYGVGRPLRRVRLAMWLLALAGRIGGRNVKIDASYNQPIGP